jgi:hypothetical protein
MTVKIEFCGEAYRVEQGSSFTIGREADLVVDDNPFLHRRFLRIDHENSMWWIANIGSQLSATLSNTEGTLQAWLAPGATLPIVFENSTVWFTAGPTTYEFGITLDDAPFHAALPETPRIGSTTYGRTSMTPEQRLLIIALAEPMLRRRVRGAVNAPTSAEAAARLGWTVTKFNRKLDHVCQKLERLGVLGMHGGPDRLASDRKARLIEYALATRMVDAQDLDLLEECAARTDEEPGRR